MVPKTVTGGWSDKPHLIQCTPVKIVLVIQYLSLGMGLLILAPIIIKPSPSFNIGKSKGQDAILSEQNFNFELFRPPVLKSIGVLC